MQKSNFIKAGKTTGAVLVVSLLLALAVFGATTVSAADVEIENSTLGVDSDTSSVYAEINNSASSSANATIEWVGVDSDGNTTGTLDSRSVTVSSDTTKLYEYQNVNASNYDSVRVKVTLDNSTASEENVSATSGIFQQISGSGTGFLDGSTSGFSNKVIAAFLAVIVLVGVSRRKD